MNIFLYKFAESFLIHQRTIAKKKFEIKSFNIFQKFPKTAETVFDLKNSIHIFLSISSVFGFKQAKEHILFQVKPLKKI